MYVTGQIWFQVKNFWPRLILHFLCLLLALIRHELGLEEETENQPGLNQN